MQPRQPLRFWDHVRRKAAEVGDWDLVEKIVMPRSGDELTAGGVTKGVGEQMACLVFKAAPNSGQNDDHHVIAWKVVQDLQTKWINMESILQK